MIINIPLQSSQPVPQWVARALVIGATMFYAASLAYGYENYLNPVWDYYGFSYVSPSGVDILYGCVVLLVVASLIPIIFDRPSVVILFFLFAIVYIPTIIVTLSLNNGGAQQHWGILTSITVAFAISSIASRYSLTGRIKSNGMPGQKIIHYVVGCWLLAVLINFVSFYEILGFANLDLIYDQRELSRSDNFLINYSQTLLISVFSLTLFVIGLYYRSFVLLGMGVLGCLLIYSISAQKTVLLLPIIVYLFFRFQISSIWWVKIPALPLFLLGIITFILSYTYKFNDFAEFLAAMLVFRTLAIPGLTYTQYDELFSQLGYTWWSHVKGFSLIISAPIDLANHPRWPSLGFIVGDYTYGIVDLNANANLFSGDGLAAAGPFGVLVIGVIFSIWLTILDRAAVLWDPRFSLLVVIPLAISLTNGHFFTNLVSFGGILWVLVFKYIAPTTNESRLLRNK